MSEKDFIFLALVILGAKHLGKKINMFFSLVIEEPKEQ
jgi:hypothetical protein